jgi:hypothetical protein
MNTIIRFFCPDCKVEGRGITYGGLPVQFLSGRFPHRKDCPDTGDIWIQVYEGVGADASPPGATEVMVEKLAGLEEFEYFTAGTRPRGDKMTATLDRGYASVRVVEGDIEVQLVDDDRAIGVVFRQAEVGEVIDGEVLDAPGKITLTMSPALARALLEKLYSRSSTTPTSTHSKRLPTHSLLEI